MEDPDCSESYALTRSSLAKENFGLVSILAKQFHLSQANCVRYRPVKAEGSVTCVADYRLKGSAHTEHLQGGSLELRTSPSWN
jgi:hypothetical protein